MNAILKPSVSLEIASAKEVQQAMANSAEVSKAWRHPLACEQVLQLWLAKLAAKENMSERQSSFFSWDSCDLSPLPQIESLVAG